MELGNDEHLELERGEDIDTVNADADPATQARILEQIKARSTRSITLRSAEALEALANFCHHRATNPLWNLRFRFITTARSGVEEGWDRPDSGIETWTALQRGRYEENVRAEAIAALRAFLKSCVRPEKASPEAWHAFQQVLVSDDAQLEEIILAFEWGMGSGDHAYIEKQIVSALAGSMTPEEASQAYEHLFAFVFRLLCQPGQKLLTKNLLTTELQAPTVTRADRAIVQLVRSELEQMAARVGTMEAAMVHQAKEMASLTQTVEFIGKSLGFDAAFALSAVSLSTELPDLVSPCAPRQTLVDQLLARAHADGVVAIVAEPGSGKTQTLRLATQKGQRSVHWLNLPRHATEEQACILLDALVRKVGNPPDKLPLQEKYDAAAQQFRGTLVVIEDLPRLVPGGPLAMRVDRLADRLRGVDAPLVLSSYYPLPATTEELLGKVQFHIPRFTITDVADLLAAADAPPEFRAEKIYQLLATVTEGLPTLVMAAVRYLAIRNWKFTASELEGLFLGEFASAHRHDARSLLQITVSDPEERELLIRMSLAIGAFSMEDIAAVARVPEPIRLPGEKVQRSTGVWLQQIGRDRYLRSPLITSVLADSLDPATRNGVHFALALRILRRKQLDLLEAFTCVNHLMMAGEVTFAVTVVMQTLVAFLELEEPIHDDIGFANMWPTREGLGDVDLNLQINLRAMQLAVRAKQGRDVAAMIETVDGLIAEAGGQGWGVPAGASGLAIHLVWRDRILANKYLLQALASYKTVRLPDGSPLPVASYPLEDMLWISAYNCTSEADVDSWLVTISRFTPEQLETLKRSDLKEDNVTILCDGIWLRVYQKPEPERNWKPVKKKLEEIEATARAIDFPLLEAAALRTRIMILAEWDKNLDAAIALSESSLERFPADDCRFLIIEVMGRQLSYAGKKEQAIRWLERALECDAYRNSLWRRNVLITMAELHGGDKAKDFTAEAVRISEDGKWAPLVYVETLAEHAIALWKAGEARPSFDTFEEATNRMFTQQTDANNWKGTFARLFGVVAYFSSLSSKGQPEPGQVEPQQGFSLITNEDAHANYRAEQLSYISVRLAMFADGVNDISKAAAWTWRAMQSAKEVSAAWDAVRLMAWRALPEALLSSDFARVAQLVAAMTALDVNHVVATAQALPLPTGPGETSTIKDLAASPPVGATSGLRVIPIVPIAVRLAFLRFRGATNAEILAFLAAIDAVIPPDLQAERFVVEIRRALVEEGDWGTLRDTGYRAIADHEYVRGLISCIGAMDKAPLSQSLYLQTYIAENLEGFFKTCPSVYREIVAPFFVTYWERAIAETTGEFRTAQSYTEKQLTVTDGTPEGTRKLLRAMRFCLGVKLPDHAMRWLDASP